MSAMDLALPYEKDHIKTLKGSTTKKVIRNFSGTPKKGRSKI